MGKWLSKLLGEGNERRKPVDAEIDNTRNEEEEVQERKAVRIEPIHKPIEARMLNVEFRLMELEQMLTQQSPNTGNKVLSPLARKFRKMKGY